MIQFKRFAAGSYTDKAISDFTNTHIIEKDKYLENGDIIFYYREVDDIGTDTLTLIETVARAVQQAQTEKFTAELGITESDGALADIASQIAETNPNEKEKWDALQGARKFHEGQKIMHEKTITERDTQIFDLTAKHGQLVKDFKKGK